MIDIQDYSEKYLRQYADEAFETTLVRIRRKCVLQSISRHAHGRILEVGCGMEPLFEFVAGPSSFVIVEPSSEFVRNARSRAAGREVTIVEGFLEDVYRSLATSSFDFIVVSSLLHEVRDPAALLSVVRSLCQPQTVVHFNVPNVRSFHRLLALEMGLIHDLFEQSDSEKRFQRHTRFDRPRFLELLQSAGFEVLESETYFVKPFTHSQMEALLRSGLFNETLIDGLDRMTRYMPEMGCEMYANVRRHEPH